MLGGLVAVALMWSPVTSCYARIATWESLTPG